MKKYKVINKKEKIVDIIETKDVPYDNTTRAVLDDLEVRLEAYNDKIADIETKKVILEEEIAGVKKALKE